MNSFFFSRHTVIGILGKYNGREEHITYTHAVDVFKRYSKRNYHIMYINMYICVCVYIICSTFENYAILATKRQVVSFSIKAAEPKDELLQIFLPAFDILLSFFFSPCRFFLLLALLVGLPISFAAICNCLQNFSSHRTQTIPLRRHPKTGDEQR